MTLPAAQHPIWALARIGAVLVFAYVAMAGTAENFDETELECIKWMLFAVMGYEGVQGILQNFVGKK